MGNFNFEFFLSCLIRVLVIDGSAVAGGGQVQRTLSGRLVRLCKRTLSGF